MGALISVFTGAILVLFAGLATGKKTLQSLSIATVVVALAFAVMQWSLPAQDFRSMLVFDQYSGALTGIMLVATLLVMLSSGYGFKHLGESLGDNYGLMLFSLFGGICMVSFQNMVILFLGVEILSIPLYVLAGSRRDELASNEAGLKYFLLGAFATGILLMGIALLYGATGTFDITKMGAHFTANGLQGYGYLGFVLLTIGLCFKISAAPFHFWSPDVYQGSPTQITTFMASVVKLAAFGALIRMFNVSFISVAGEWKIMLATIACLTMVVGNLGALMQDSFKRMLAYSSISHAGYLLMGVVALSNDSLGSLFYYLAAYSVATIVAFTIYMIVSEQNASDRFSAFNGLGKSKPLMAFALTIALLSMAGIPPLAGFFGKYFLFTKAMASNPGLVIIAIINSIISIAYYFRPISAMYFKNREDIDNVVELPSMIKVSLWISIVLLIVFVVAPGYVSQLIH